MCVQRSRRRSVRPGSCECAAQRIINRRPFMSSPVPFEPIADLFERSLSIRHVYGEPVQHGDKTVIPVAQVMYGFGAGGGKGPGRMRKNGNDSHEAEGAGGGGGLRRTPVGALEIGPGGTRFVRVNAFPPLLGAALLGLVAAWFIARLR